MNISYRIRTIAECVTKGNVVADVGCDHGLTSIYLIEQGIASKVYAMDINRAPLLTAGNNVAAYGFEDKIIIRQSDGISAVTVDDNIDTILISGMGGNLIIDILKQLENNPVIKESVSELVLSPQSDIHKVRKYLHNSGYCIVDEKMIYDTGKYYVIISASPGNEKYDNYAEYKYGKLLIDRKDNVLYEYLIKELEKKYKILDNIREVLLNEESAKEKTARLEKESTRLEGEICVINEITERGY